MFYMLPRYSIIVCSNLLIQYWKLYIIKFSGRYKYRDFVYDSYKRYKSYRKKAVNINE